MDIRELLMLFNFSVRWVTGGWANGACTGGTTYPYGNTNQRYQHRTATCQKSTSNQANWENTGDGDCTNRGLVKPALTQVVDDTACCQCDCVCVCYCDCACTCCN